MGNTGWNLRIRVSIEWKGVEAIAGALVAVAWTAFTKEVFVDDGNIRAYLNCRVNVLTMHCYISVKVKLKCGRVTLRRWSEKGEESVGEPIRATEGAKKERPREVASVVVKRSWRKTFLKTVNNRHRKRRGVVIGRRQLASDIGRENRRWTLERDSWVWGVEHEGRRKTRGVSLYRWKRHVVLFLVERTLNCTRTIKLT